MSIAIYVLRDPRTGDARYVGQTANPTARLAGHVSEARTAAAAGRLLSMKQEWIAELLASQSMPMLETVEIVAQGRASLREQHWMRRLRAAGAALCNGNHAPSTLLRRPRADVIFVAVRLPADVLALVDAEVDRVNGSTPGAAATKTSVIIASIRAHCGAS